MKSLLTLAALGIAVSLSMSMPARAQTSSDKAPMQTESSERSRATIRALAFVSSLEQIDLRGRAPASLTPYASGVPVDVSQQPVLQDKRFVDSIDDFLGKPLTGDMIRKLTLQVNAFLGFIGQDLAYVAIPEQDVTSGVLQVLVLQPRLGALKVEGAVQFPESVYRDSIRVQPGEKIDQRTLTEDLAWISKANPFRSAIVVTSPGDELGETDIAIRVTEQRPWNVQFSADNTGTKTTKRERLGFGATYGNAFGLGHLVSYNLSASPDFHAFVAHSASYTVPLASRDILSFSANYAEVNASLPAPLDSNGYSAGLSARFERPLASAPGYTHSVLLGFDYRLSDSNLLFSAQPVFGNKTDILQLVLGYNGALQGSMGRLAFNLSTAMSPGGVTRYNSDTDFQGSRAFADSRYHYQTLALDGLLYLPGSWNWAVNARLQVASDNLLSSEQLAAAGTYGVRGFEEGALYADQGIVLRNDISAPDFAVGTFGQGRAYAFIDTANVRNVRRVSDEPGHYEITSIGFGTKLTLRQNINFRFELGKPVSSNLGPDVGTGWRAHAGLSYLY